MRRLTWMMMGVAVAMGVPATARTPHRAQRIDQTLDAGASGASGRESLVLHGDASAKFEIAADGLAAHAAHDVVLHGIKIATLATNKRGHGMVRFRSRAVGRARALGFEPRGLPLEIRNPSGTIVLQGSLPDLDPDMAACCDADGNTCSARPPGDCEADGGTVADARSCLPNPCDDRTADGTFVCCLPCGDPPVCELRTEADCLADDGFVTEGDSCDPNPCAPAAPVQTQCCVIDGDQQFFSKCEVRTPDECALGGGVDMGEGGCDPSPCERP